MYQYIFVDHSNNEHYKKAVLEWLEADYHEKGEPSGHFWHNQNAISDLFDECTALVVLDDQGTTTLGYMVWEKFGNQVEIDIVEVKEAFRRQGIFKTMLAKFAEQFADVCILTASVIDQSVVVFERMGWTGVRDSNQGVKHYKLVTPSVTPSNILSDGWVIGTYSKVDHPNPEEHIDSYVVSRDLEHYSLKYFQIDLEPLLSRQAASDDDQGSDRGMQLQTPIITPFHYEGYMAVFFNKEKIVDGKVKHLFDTNYASCTLSQLVINQLIPLDQSLFEERGFFDSKSIESHKRKETSVTSSAVSFFQSTEADSDDHDDASPKKQRTVEAPAFVHSSPN